MLFLAGAILCPSWPGSEELDADLLTEQTASISFPLHRAWLLVDGTKDGTQRVCTKDGKDV